MLLVVTVGLSTSGCWNYNGLNELTIVSGFSVDRKEGEDYYTMAFQIMDLSQPIKSVGPKAKVIESVGYTLFDAIRNAGTKLAGRLYFGNAQVMVIGERVAKEDNLRGLIDFLMRDAELRETVYLTVSQEDPAEVLKQEGVDMEVSAFEIKRIIETDNEVSASTISDELYQIYNDLESPGVSPLLPVVRTIQSHKEKIVQANGSAVFKDQRLTGYLSTAESKSLLFIQDSIEGGILPMYLETPEVRGWYSLEIKKNKTKVSYYFNENGIHFSIKTKTDVMLAEVGFPVDISEKALLRKLEVVAEEQLELGMMSLIHRAQQELKADIFRFGNQIYRNDLKIWRQLEPHWETEFSNLNVDVQSEVSIIGTSFLKSY